MTVSGLLVAASAVVFLLVAVGVTAGSIVTVPVGLTLLASGLAVERIS